MKESLLLALIILFLFVLAILAGIGLAFGFAALIQLLQHA